MYKCGWNGCEKAYGTLNHLNAHVTMQAHGQKRTPEGKRSRARLSQKCSRADGTELLAGCDAFFFKRGRGKGEGLDFKFGGILVDAKRHHAEAFH